MSGEKSPNAKRSKSFKVSLILSEVLLPTDFCYIVFLEIARFTNVIEAAFIECLEKLFLDSLIINLLFKTALVLSTLLAVGLKTFFAI